MNHSPPRGKRALPVKEHQLVEDYIPRVGSPPRHINHATPCFASGIPRFSKSDTLAPSPTSYNTNRSSFSPKRSGGSPFKSNTERFPDVRAHSPPSTSYQINYDFLEKKGQLSASSFNSTAKRFQFSPWEQANKTSGYIVLRKKFFPPNL